ncbi:hypothetical protein CFP56_005715 [Quercus suber]|uniref:Uncharacterized protein n=1 Tax=Quercus suber TaxID=58331 RepID=A0AAW0LA83_QUESU
MGIQDDRGLAGERWQFGIESAASQWFSLGRDAHALDCTGEIYSQIITARKGLIKQDQQCVDKMPYC